MAEYENDTKDLKGSVGLALMGIGGYLYYGGISTMNPDLAFPLVCGSMFGLGYALTHKSVTDSYPLEKLELHPIKRVMGYFEKRKMGKEGLKKE